MTPLEAAQAQLDAAQADLDRAILLLGALAVFYLALLAGLFVHEAGHAFMAWRAGLAIRMIRIGRGPVLMRRLVGRTWLVIRWWPASGQVTVLIPRQWQRGQATGLILGGIAGNALLLSAAVFWLAVDPQSRWWTIPIILAQGVRMAAAAVPRTWRGRDKVHVTDGEWLRRLHRDPERWSLTRAQMRVARRMGVTGPLPLPSPAFSEIGYQLTRPERRNERWARDDANAVLRRLLSRNDLTWFERSAVIDGLVLLEAQHGDGLVTSAEMETWSTELLALGNTTEMQVTRAAALYRLGRLDDAETLLAQGNGGARAALADLFKAYTKLARLRMELAASAEPS